MAAGCRESSHHLTVPVTKVAKSRPSPLFRMYHADQGGFEARSSEAEKNNAEAEATYLSASVPDADMTEPTGCAFWLCPKLALIPY
jgi:hypothetical protein